MSKLPVDQFFQLLRYAIGTSTEFPVDIPEEMWKDIYKIAQQQSLLGVLFHGIQSHSSVRMEKGLLLQWYAMSEQLKRRNIEMNKKCVELREMLKKDGLESCILKGQGNALMYPDPNVRMPGDIDVWVKPVSQVSGEGLALSGGEEEGFVRKVIEYARKKEPEAEICYHHVDGGTYKGVEYEIHYRPSFMNNLIHNRRLQRWCREQAEEQFAHEVELPDGAGCICVPTHYFNCIYQISHIYNHVIHEGVGLRQLVDYYYLLKAINFNDNPNLNAGHVGSNGLEFRNESLESTLRYLGMYKVTTAVMWVLHEALGLEEKYLIVPPNEKLGKFLLDEIMRGGNFGQYNTDGSKKKPEGQVAHNLHRLQRDLCLLRYFPSECLWEPIFRIYHFFWRKWR